MIYVEKPCRCGRMVRLPLALLDGSEWVECPGCGWRLRVRLVVWAEPPAAREGEPSTQEISVLSAKGV